MISVDAATARIIAAFVPVEAETVSIDKAAGRVLAVDAVAGLTQPPAPMSSMDGYAVRACDATTAPVTLEVIGSAPAGHPFAGEVGAGQAVRIFTGGVVPQGADAVVIQENTSVAAQRVTLHKPAKENRHIRRAGLDFRAGDVLVRQGKRLTARGLALLAAGNLATLRVRRRPRIAFVATGDELLPPGSAHGPGSIVAASGYGLAALIDSWGGEARDLGILPDRAEAIAGLAERAGDADLIVTLGGASVGDHDLVQSALGPEGFTLDFWKIAMRPGKPLIFGRLGATPLLGLPGNPVSTLVCAILFLRAAIASMLGTDTGLPHQSARLTLDLALNDSRQDYLRSRLSLVDGEYWVEPFPVQDSSMLSLLAAADALVVRAPNAPPLHAGERVQIIPLYD